MKFTFLGIPLVSCLLLLGCLPSVLSKYQKGVKAPVEAPRRSEVKKAPAEPVSAFQKVSTSRYRYARPISKVWASAIKVLLSHYNINIIDRGSGLMTTEWDSFYIDGKVYRNKVSLSITEADRESATLKIYNNVEELMNKQGSGIWLPSSKGEKEVSRIATEIGRHLGMPVNEAL